MYNPPKKRVPVTLDSLAFQVFCILHNTFKIWFDGAKKSIYNMFKISFDGTKKHFTQLSGIYCVCKVRVMYRKCVLGLAVVRCLFFKAVNIGGLRVLCWLLWPPNTFVKVLAHFIAVHKEADFIKGEASEFNKRHHIPTEYKYKSHQPLFIL